MRTARASRERVEAAAAAIRGAGPLHADARREAAKRTGNAGTSLTPFSSAWISDRHLFWTSCTKDRSLVAGDANYDGVERNPSNNASSHGNRDGACHGPLGGGKFVRQYARLAAKSMIACG